MFDYFSKRLRFVRIFLSADNLNQLRAYCLAETSEAREVVDLGLAVIVNNDADVEAVSLSKAKPKPLIKGYDYITGKTLFTCAPEEHEQFIKTFPLEMVGQGEWIATQQDVVRRETERFIDAWLSQHGSGGVAEVDFAKVAFDLSFAIISQTFLGADYDEEQKKDFEEMAVHLNRYLLYEIPPIFPSFFAAKKRWYQRVDAIIEQRKAAFAAGGDLPGDDMLSTLLKKGIAIDDLTARSLSQAYWAGVFTISAVTLGGVFHVGKDSDVRDYLLQDPGEHGTHVAKEALRMYPGAPIYDRGVLAGDQIEVPSGHVFKAGSRPFVCPHIIQTDPVYWPDPLKFDPKRFVGHEGFQSKAFIPFGYAPEDGGRACTGRYYALAVLPWMISTVFDKFDVEVLADKLQMKEYAACAYASLPATMKLQRRAPRADAQESRTLAAQGAR